jgi:hypothetical protein
MENKGDPESDSSASSASLLSTSRGEHSNTIVEEIIELHELPPVAVEYPPKVDCSLDISSIRIDFFFGFD